MPGLIGAQNRIALKDIWIERAGKGPRSAAIVAVSPAGLAEIGSDGVELPPTNRHSIPVSGIDGYRRLVRGVPHDIIAASIDIYLITREGTGLGDHGWRN